MKDESFTFKHGGERETERNVNHIHKWKMIVACVHEDENKWYAAIELTMKYHWYFPIRIYGREEIVSLLQLRVELKVINDFFFILKTIS